MYLLSVEGKEIRKFMYIQNNNNEFYLMLLQAFVHDPLINWRLFNFNEVPQMSALASAHLPAVVNSDESAANRELQHPLRGARERELLQVLVILYPKSLSMYAFSLMTLMCDCRLSINLEMLMRF